MYFKTTYFAKTAKDVDSFNLGPAAWHVASSMECIRLRVSIQIWICLVACPPLEMTNSPPTGNSTNSLHRPKNIEEWWQQ